MTPTPHTDLSEAHNVEILVDQTGKMWVNADGVCVLRIGHVDRMLLDHTRRSRLRKNETTSITRRIL